MAIREACCWNLKFVNVFIIFLKTKETRVDMFRWWPKVHVPVHHNRFLYNKTNQMYQFPKFTPAWNCTCFGQFLCPSSGVYSRYTLHWCMSYRFEDSFRAGPGWSYSKAVCLLRLYKFDCLWVLFGTLSICAVKWMVNAGTLSSTLRISFYKCAFD